MAASADPPDLYLCQICLEDQTTRNPRLLFCHHSFCEECIQKLVKKEKIECPTCRQVTLVDNDSVKTLSINFMLLQVKEHMSKMTAVVKVPAHPSTDRNCQKCNVNKTRSKCFECNAALCKDCCEDHGENAGHPAFLVCFDHQGDRITNVCIQCCEGLCSTCAKNEQHEDHIDKVMSYPKGIQEIKQTIEQLKSSIDRELVGVIQFKEKHMERLLKTDKLLQNLDEEHQAHVLKAEKVLQDMQLLKQQRADIEECIRISEADKGYIYDLDKALQAASSAGDVEKIKLFPELKAKANKINKERKEIVPIDVNTEENFDKASGHEEHGRTQNLSDEDWLKEARLVYQTNDLMSLGIKQPSKIYCVKPGVVLVIDMAASVMVTVDTNGCMLRKYRIPYGHVNDVVYYDYSRLFDNSDGSEEERCFYILYSGNIEQRLYPGFQFHTSFRPNVRNMSNLLVIHKHTMIIYNATLKRMYEYDVYTKTVKRVGEYLDLMVTSLAAFAPFRLHLGYILLDSFNNKMMIINSSWRAWDDEEEELDLKRPSSATSTDRGILIANTGDHSISFKAYNGATKRHILTEKDGIRFPVDIDYRDKHLWVADITCKISMQLSSVMS